MSPASYNSSKFPVLRRQMALLTHSIAILERVARIDVTRLAALETITIHE